MKSFQGYLSEGRYDPANFKAIFLAGAPGSGKSNVIQQAGLTSLGFRVINPDQSFEHLLDKNLITKDFTKEETPEQQSARMRSYELQKKQFELYSRQAKGIIIDGTGGFFPKIEEQRYQLMTLGYDTYMLMVNISVETAIKRQKERFKQGGRALPADVVKRSHENIQRLKPVYRRLFGRKYFSVESELATREDYTKIYNIFRQIVNQPISNPIAKKVMSKLGYL